MYSLVSSTRSELCLNCLAESTLHSHTFLLIRAAPDFSIPRHHEQSMSHFVSSDHFELNRHFSLTFPPTLRELICRGDTIEIVPDHEGGDCLGPKYEGWRAFGSRDWWPGMSRILAPREFLLAWKLKKKSHSNSILLCPNFNQITVHRYNKFVDLWFFIESVLYPLRNCQLARIKILKINL